MNSLSTIQVRDQNGNHTANLLAEVSFGSEPRLVALSPDDQEAYITNALGGTVSVVFLSGSNAFTVVAVIPVSSEPRGLAITPNGTRLFIANAGASEPESLDLDSKVFAGDIIRTLENSHCRIGLNDGTVLTLGERTEMVTALASFTSSLTEAIIEVTPTRSSALNLDGTVHVVSLQEGIPGEVVLQPGEGTNIELGKPPTPPNRWSAERVERVKQATYLP